MSKRHENNSAPTELIAGDIEYEMGIPIPGVILAKELWVQTAIKKLPESGQLDFAAIFGRLAPIAIDIGCGNGRFAISSAVRRPDWDHIAFDILPAVIRYGTRRGNQRGLANLRFAVCDGWRFLESYLPPESVREIHIYHPQPFADRTQSSRRMLTPDFLSMMHNALQPDGQVCLQSDNREYWDYICGIMGRVFRWEEVSGPWPEDQHGRSRREVLSIEQGLPIFRGVGIKRSELTSEELALLIADLPQPRFKVEGNESSGHKRSAWKPMRRDRNRR